MGSHARTLMSVQRALTVAVPMRRALTQTAPSLARATAALLATASHVQTSMSVQRTLTTVTCKPHASTDRMATFRAPATRVGRGGVKLVIARILTSAQMEQITAMPMRRAATPMAASRVRVMLVTRGVGCLATTSTSAGLEPTTAMRRRLARTRLEASPVRATTDGQAMA